MTQKGALAGTDAANVSLAGRGWTRVGKGPLILFPRIVLSAFSTLFSPRSIYAAKEMRAREERKKDEKTDAEERVTYAEETKDAEGKKMRATERERERERCGGVATSLLEGQIVCLSGALVRTNKWKQIISWPHYEKESMANRGGFGVCSWNGCLSLFLSLLFSPSACHGCPRAAVTRRTSAVRPVINAGLGPTRRFSPRVSCFHDF